MSAPDGPPDALVRSLVDGPSLLRGLEWHAEVGSTNVLAAAAADRGAPEIHAVLADVQTSGRGRLGRGWQAPPGTSLMGSYLLRPRVDAVLLPLLPLLTGLALAEAVAPHVPGVEVALKWPNDLLVDGRKSAGILLETAGQAVIVGVGLNVDWRGVDRPEDLADATSLAEAAGADVDRWRVLAAFAGVFGNRYAEWCADPRAFLPDYRRRCVTIGRDVRVSRVGQRPVEGRAVEVAEDGALVVRGADGQVVRLSAGDVEHVRAAR
jgi:BirA family transcriptional regulator, biotin operon repressor / biotin---[acetyl-CoA-carboxylase] ligase